MRIARILLALMMFPVLAIAQHTVKGTVKDTDGQPLAGVNIVEKGTYRGTTTNSRGEFNLKATSDNAILVFSYIGYSKQEVHIAHQDQMDVCHAGKRDRVERHTDRRYAQF